MQAFSGRIETVLWYAPAGKEGDPMRLREARQRKFFSVRELAKAAGVAPATVAETEAGRRIPSFTSARKIAAALGCNPMDIEEFAARLDAELGGKDAA